MRVLVTGGAGFAGSVAVRELLSRGHEVRVLDALLYGGQGLLDCYGHERFQFVRGDIRSAEVVHTALEGMEAVVHLAAIVGDPACARDKVLAREVNLDASIQLFNLARQAGIRLVIFASTCSNYGKMDNPLELLTEESALRPVSFYAETKVQAEQALLGTSATVGFTPCVLRFATLFGLSPRMRFDLTVNEFTMELLTKRRLKIYGEQFWRPYVHVGDAARAMCLVLEGDPGAVAGEAFNVGDTRMNYQKGQLVDLICRHLGNHSQIERVPQGEDPRDYRVSFEKISRRLGFRVSRTVEAGVREVAHAIEQGIVSDVNNPCYRNVPS